MTDAIKEFEDTFTVMRDELVDDLRTLCTPENAIHWFERSMRHNVLGGKMNRGLAVVQTLRLLKRNEPVSEDEIFKANLLGWCVEWNQSIRGSQLQAFFLVADDIMDNSQTRRGQPCWYRVDGVRHIAINNGFILESSIFQFLKTHFRKEPYYVDLLELVHDTTYKSELGQLSELMSTVEDATDLSRFSMERYQFIVKHKTAYYSFYLPVALAMHMAGVQEEAAFKQAEAILLSLGEYFQVQDDYLDVYGDSTITGKIGTDIEDNKGTWLVVQALTKANPEQRKILDNNYGRRDEANIQAVKEVYNEIDVQSLFRAYEDESYNRLKTLIAKVDHPRLNPDVFTWFVELIYMRTK